MTSRLPDVALEEPAAIHSVLDWVGMRGIDLPLRLDPVDSPFPVIARVDAQVDLPSPATKGIHMSRLHRLLDNFAEEQSLTPIALRALLLSMIASHADCQSTRARLSFSFSLLCKRPALVTPGLSGWKSYPVFVNAIWTGATMMLELGVDIVYSSTCPCSAALARKVVQDRFDAAFTGQSHIDRNAILDWLGQYATAATPHSQRSVAHVRIQIGQDALSLDILQLIDLIEQALGTPVQTAVKRADEQAFAVLNGQNLMYVEDAARKVQQTLRKKFGRFSVAVEHLESLHPHDATAQVSFNMASRGEASPWI